MNIIVLEENEINVQLKLIWEQKYLCYSNKNIITKSSNVPKFNDLPLLNLLIKWAEKNKYTAPEEIIYCSNLTILGIYILTSDAFNKHFFIKTTLNKGEFFSLILESKNMNFKLKLKDVRKLLGTSHKEIPDFSYVNNLQPTISFPNKDLMKIQLILTTLHSDIGFLFLRYLSIARIGKELFLKYYNFKKIKIELAEKWDMEFRKGYFGGRCEVFENTLEEGNIYHYDFKNMYATVMAEKFPIKKFKKLKKVHSVKQIGFYYVKVRSEKKYIPILPHNRIDDQNSFWENKKTIFANGEFEGLYWYEELLLFIQEGGEVLEILYAFIWESDDYPFKEFAEHCIKKRNESAINKVIWKNLITSFYGRMGMEKIKTETKIIRNEDYVKWCQENKKKLKNSKWNIYRWYCYSGNWNF